MKIAIVSPYISTTDDLGCYQSQQLNLAAELINLGDVVDIITSKRSPERPELEILDCGIRIIRLPALTGRCEALFKQPIMRGLWGQLGRGKYDVIQSSEDFTISTFMSALCALTGRSRLVIYQGIYCRSRKMPARALMTLYDSMVGPVIRRACSVAVCKTSAARRYLEDKGFRKATVIPVGVNTSIFFPNGRAVGSGCGLLNVGSLIPLKNFGFLLDVFRILGDLNPRARLTIVGTGPEEKRIASYIERHGLKERVVMAGKVPNRDLRKYYSAADLFLLMSKVEIFGMVMLEAMACGCPVMSTPTPGALDIIRDGHNGFIVDGDDPVQIAHRISEILLDREKLRAAGEEALRTANRHSWPVIAKQYRDLYHNYIND